MKLFVVVLCAIAGLAAAQSTDIDWSTVRPIYEYKEWQDAHPGYMRLVQRADLMRQMQRVNFRPGGRIVGGNEAERHQFPYKAGLVVHLASGNGFCGGALISKTYVMTAAHCINGQASMIVVLGAHNVFIQTEATQQRIFVNSANFKIHPRYSAADNTNDIAVANLGAEGANYDNVHIRSVRLPNWRQESLTFAGQDAIASGWGRWGNGNDLSTYLRFTEVPIITNLACRTRFPTSVTDDNICADGGNGGACEGDNGGPLTVVEADGRTTQVGVASFGLGLTCELSWPTVYLRVTRYLGWIEEASDRTISENWD